MSDPRGASAKVRADTAKNRSPRQMSSILVPAASPACPRCSRRRFSARLPKRSTPRTTARMRFCPTSGGGIGGKQVAAVERARHRLERVVRVGELVRGGDAAEPLGGRQQETVVGADIEAPFRIDRKSTRLNSSHIPLS